MPSMQYYKSSLRLIYVFAGMLVFAAVSMSMNERVSADQEEEDEGEEEDGPGMELAVLDMEGALEDNMVERAHPYHQHRHMQPPGLTVTAMKAQLPGLD